MPDPDTIGFRYPHQVSGGQLQRAMTAMALSCRPDLIIFDEPTTALDVTTQIEVLATIKDIVKQFNTAAIYITHDLAVVAQMADRIKVLRYGESVEESETRAMLSDPQQDYTKSLWAVRSFRKTEHPPLPEEIPLLKVENVTASYARSLEPVLEPRSISKSIAGETVAIVGESGSGKSTTARVITGLLPPITGADRVRWRRKCRRIIVIAAARTIAADSDDLPDGGYRDQSASAYPRHHRPAAVVLPAHGG